MIAVVSACSSSAPDDVRTFDACAPVRLDVDTPTDARLAGIDTAIAAWQALGVTTFSRDAVTDETIAIQFADASPAEYGLFEGNAIAINVELAGDELAITIAHELGHAVGLVHIDPAVRSSVMNPGNLVVDPTSDDRDAIAALWGSCH
ncbi:MAG TPA: hypothetical protein VGO00_13590 [Kofleriaceae bacterium]|nr:hypothetical protein [Kofleriaceae bacterium]